MPNQLGDDARPQRPAEASAGDRPEPARTAQQPAPATGSKPEAPLEFSQFVAETVGAELPVFGHELFEDVPATFAPVESIAAPANYVVGPGDELNVRTWGQLEGNVRAVVDRNGAIYLPKVGQVSVAGVRAEQLEGVLRSSISRFFHDFEVSVTLGRLRSIQVFVVGQARRPGSYTISSLSTLVNALFASGGPSYRGSMRRIEVKRGDRVMTEFDLYDLLLRGDKTKDVVLQSGDVIFIPPVGNLVAISGSVNVPAIYELRQEASLDDALRLAGGLTTMASGEKVVVERIENRARRVVDEFALTGDRGGLKLSDGDIVRVLPLSPRVERAVTLKGNVAQPGRYSWRPEMRVSDLITGWEKLVTPEYWRSRNTIQAGRNIRDDLRQVIPEINWNYAVIERLNQDDITTRLVPFDLGKAMIERDPAQNLLLEPGDIVRVLSHNDMPVPSKQRNIFVYLEGELARPGVYRVEPGETLRQVVARVNGITPEAFLYGAEFTRESVRVEQQAALDRFLAEYEREIQRESLQAARDVREGEEATGARELEAQMRIVQQLRSVKATGRVILGMKPGDDSAAAIPDVVLEDGDRFFVPARSSTVFVAGAVNNRNSYLYDPDSRVADYLARAGGTTRTGDGGHMMLLRADGSVLNRRQHGGFWRGSFQNLRLQPGDTIYVPERIVRPSTIRRLRDWSQIFSQFALGAAAIRILDRP